MRTRIAGQWWRALFRLSEHRTFHGCRVGIFLPQSSERLNVESKCAAALDLISEHAPRHLARIHTYADGILVFGDTGPLGQWRRSARLILLKQRFVLDAEVQPAQLASTLVHEATHAWLEHHGFVYIPSRRRRIEAICYRAEAAFARRIPNGSELAIRYEACAQALLEQSDDEWSAQAFRARKAQELRELGTPEWLVTTVTRIATVLSNERCN